MAFVGSVKTDGFEMDYCRFGTGARTLVIIPGLSVQSVMGAADSVEDAYKRMHDDFTTYLFDRRKEVPAEYSIKDMARDTVAAIRELGLSNIYLMGTSQGGMISMVIAMEYPDIVKKLVLGSTSSHVWEKQQGPIENWIKLASEKDRKGLYLDFAKEIYPPDVFEQYKGYFEEVSATVTDEELSKFVILARSIKDFNVTGDLSRISCPVLALGDFKDLVLDSDATMEIAQELDEKPDFKLYMYAGYGHAAYDTAPDYKDRVYKFLMEE